MRQFVRTALNLLVLLPLLTSCNGNDMHLRATGFVQNDVQNDFHPIATPPFYRIEGHGGATLLLMGTIHLGPPEGWEFSPELKKSLERADRFILEIDPRELTEAAISRFLENTVIIRPPHTLIDLVSPETAKLLEENDARLAKMGMPRNARRWKKPWYVALWLVESTSTLSGFDTSASAEDVILKASGTRPLHGLETLEEQLGLFDQLSPQLQDVMLRDTLLRLETAVEDTRALVDAWRRGDEKRLAELARDGTDELPGRDAFYDVILSDRNRRWISVFESFLDDPEYAGETIFAGVGALHLVGDEGLVRLFRKSGHAVHPIDHRAEGI